jgi:hypothetical protein
VIAEAAALRLELPGRSAKQIASILYHRHGVRVAGRTVSGQLRRAGLHSRPPCVPGGDTKPTGRTSAG